RCSWYGGPFNSGNCQQCTNVSFKDEFVHNPDPISNDETPNFSYPPSQPQTSSFDQFHCFGCGDSLEKYTIDHQEHLNQQRMNDVDDRWNKMIESGNKIIQIMGEMILQQKQDLNTIPEKKPNEVIKSSVEDLVPILSESEDTSGSDSECDLPSCDDFSPINVSEEKSITFSNPLFDLNNDFTSSDDESLSDEDVSEDNVNPLFKFKDEYISSDVYPLFNEVLENIKNKDSYDSNLDEPDLLVTPLSDANKDECVDPGDDVDEIELLLHRDPSTKMSVASILEGFTNEPPLEENDDLFDLESKENKWKKILYDSPIDDLMTEDNVFDPGILKKLFSPTYVRLPFKDRHYLFFTYVIQFFLPHFTYPVDSPFLLSYKSEDTILTLASPLFIFL
nr:hypothetical protein [Tanacetum cinerariifolium]